MRGDWLKMIIFFMKCAFLTSKLFLSYDLQIKFDKIGLIEAIIIIVSVLRKLLTFI